MSREARIDALAKAAGIATGYRDAFGKTYETTPQTKASLLTAFGLPVEDEEALSASEARMAAIAAAPLEALVVVEHGRASPVPVRAPEGVNSAHLRLTDEAGRVRQERVAISGGRLTMPALPMGYHDLTITVGERTGHATVIAAPRRAYVPDVLAGDARLWGATVQAYGLRRSGDLGIGDFTSIAQAAEGVAAVGGAFLGLSPLHALFASDRGKISPYSPSSRLFLETIHIDPQAVPGFEESGAQALWEEAQAAVAPLADAALTDHAQVWAAKRPVLEKLWYHARSHGDLSGFERFRAKMGEPLQRHAVFEALAEHFVMEGRHWLGEWPTDVRRADAAGVENFARNHRPTVDFHAWLQYEADRQLGLAERRARDAGLSIGLYRDLAVGADAGGSEIWAAPEAFCPTLSVGAPPDLIAPEGQNWGLPPFNPITLAESGLAAFRALASANMRHCGALRIDHAFQLARLFLIPPGGPASAGAYVAYPFEALTAALRVESMRARCLVIAEDLGNAPEGFSDEIMKSGILSYRVLFFERGEGGAFKPPADYPRDALAVATTHDLPTFRGWWRGLDIDLRQTLGLYDGALGDDERKNRAFDRAAFMEDCVREGLAQDATPPEEPPYELALRYLARSSSQLMGVQLEDVAGELAQVNLPGVSEGHPNWRRRIGMPLETLTAPGGELAKAAASIAAEGRGGRTRHATLAAPAPRATYRLQLHKDFTFEDAVAAVPYLARLGISHVYTSPIHTARPGSTHGYDIVDHSAINPELGGEEGFLKLCEALKAHGLGLIVDTVPNHMGVGGADNPAWLAVLEWGELSPARDVFDIDWQRLGSDGKLVVPFLGDRYGDALENGTLALKFDGAEGGFSVWHYEHKFPIRPLDYPIILDRALAALPELDDAGRAVMAVSEELRLLAGETEPERRQQVPQTCEGLKQRLAQAVAQSRAVADAVERAVAFVNGVAGQPESFGTLHRILENQSYRLAHWRVASSDINYRRFFDINGLAGIRIEDPLVFARAHDALFAHVRAGRIQGLRIDHIDGLADPAGYAEALQSAIGPGFYVVIEKILEPGEKLRPWPVAGTTGYDVLNHLDGVLLDRSAEGAIEAVFRRTTGFEGSYEAALIAAKTEILETSFASELEGLVSDIKRTANADRHTRDVTANAIRRALAEIIARFPVYRSYMTPGGEIDPADVALIETTVRKAKRASRLPDRFVHDFIADALLGRVETEGAGRPDPALVQRFRRRFQQLTGPVMAKSLEDTLFYRHARLIALNEVGGDPAHFGMADEAFHDAMAERAEHWPAAMITTATHDTKRGEDARARILALAEMPQALEDAAITLEAAMREADAPDATDRMFILQSLLGAWPMEMLDGEDAAALEDLKPRLHGFLEKALREAKRHSSWVNVDEAYESAAHAFLDRVLDPSEGILEKLRPLARRLAWLGALNGLARTALKLTAPGVPDIYQGTEFWDLSLVDPDNRRPVDYRARAQALEAAAPVEELLADWRSGTLKQRLTHRLLTDRAEDPALYAEGDYEPLLVEGEGARHVLGYLRRGKESCIAVVVGRCLAPLTEGESWSPGALAQTTISLPPGTWTDLVTQTEHSHEGALSVGELFAVLPIAVLRVKR